MSEIGGFTIIAILVRALGYAGGLLAAGSGLFLAIYCVRPFRASDPAALHRVMRRTAWLGGAAAVVAALGTFAGVGIRAGRLSGMGVAGMIDPTMLQLVWEGPVGNAVLLRLAGFVALAAGLAAFRMPVGQLLVGAGALAFALSYTYVGHATEEPRWILAAALTVHLLAASFWVGAFAPLAMAARRLPAPDAAALLHAFGRTAVWVVGALVAAGASFAYVLLRTPAGLFGSAYGRILLVKLAIVAALLALAALNKLRLVPALKAGDERIRGSLVRSIRLEALAVVAILLATATLTSIATPPSREAPEAESAAPS